MLTRPPKQANQIDDLTDQDRGRHRDCRNRPSGPPRVDCHLYENDGLTHDKKNTHRHGYPPRPGQQGTVSSFEVATNDNPEANSNHRR